MFLVKSYLNLTDPYNQPYSFNNALKAIASLFSNSIPFIPNENSKSDNIESNKVCIVTQC